jgi:hypothetical protein
MSYEVLALACEQLPYRDKLRLAQLLIQLARKEEEELHPEKRVQEPKKSENTNSKEQNNDTLAYVVERLLKSKPQKKAALLNFIKAMYQFKGALSDADAEKIINELQKGKVIKIDGLKITYL